MYTVVFNSVKHQSLCDHQVIVVNSNYDLDHHSSSRVHFGVCAECHESNNWEIRHLNYIVVGPKNSELANKYYVQISSLFEYGKGYTELDVVVKLAEVYRPEYIMNGRRCLYSENYGIDFDKLWK